MAASARCPFERRRDASVHQLQNGRGVAPPGGRELQRRSLTGTSWPGNEFVSGSAPIQVSEGDRSARNEANDAKSLQAFLA